MGRPVVQNSCKTNRKQMMFEGFAGCLWDHFATPKGWKKSMQVEAVFRWMFGAKKDHRGNPKIEGNWKRFRNKFSIVFWISSGCFSEALGAPIRDQFWVRRDVRNLIGKRKVKRVHRISERHTVADSLCKTCSASNLVCCWSRLLPLLARVHRLGLDKHGGIKLDQ